MKSLVVHADAERRSALGRLLRARGHDVELGASSDEQSRDAALIVLGWTAGVDAPELARRLRRDDAVVVVLSPPRSHSDLESAIAAGAAQVLLEPIDDEPLRIALVAAEYLVSERVRRERDRTALRQSAQRFRSLVQNALDIIAVLEPDGTILYVSPSLRRVLEREPQELVGRKIHELVHDADAAAVRDAVREGAVPGRVSKVEMRVRHGNGDWRYIEAVADNLVDYPSVRGIVVNARDVTDRHELEQMLARQAFYDSLTGLANRALFMDRVDHALSQHGRRDGAPAVLFVDLDGFKKINDSYGHDVGDAAIAAAARRLLECRREGDTAARLGGDEFTLLVESVETGDDAVRVADRILDAMRRPLEVDEHRLVVTVSIGVAYSEARISAKELIRRADAAMYHAKDLGKNRYAVWEPLHDSAWPRSAPRG